MANEITLSQMLRCINGNFQFPSASGSFGNQNILANQAAIGGAQPGMISAIIAANGTLVDLNALSPSMAGGGWAMFKNADPTNFVTWGPDTGGTTLVKMGEMLPGEFAGPFRISRSVTKFRFQADTGPCDVQVFVLTP